MDVSTVMEQLSGWGDEARKKHMKKRGAGENLFGVPMGSLRGYAETLGRDHALAQALWETGNIDARMLSTVTLDPARLDRAQAERMILEAGYVDLLDKLVYDAIAEAPCAPELREAWIGSPEDVEGRVGWSLVVSGIMDKKFGPEALSRYVSLVEQGLVERRRSSRRP